MIDSASFRILRMMRFIRQITWNRDRVRTPSFHLPPRQAEFPAGVRATDGIRRRLVVFSVASAIATWILAPGPPSWNGSSLVPPARRTLGQRGERTRRRGQTPLTLRRSRVSSGHLVSRSYRPRHLYPSIAGGSGLLSRSTCILSLGPSKTDLFEMTFKYFVIYLGYLAEI